MSTYVEEIDRLIKAVSKTEEEQIARYIHSLRVAEDMKDTQGVEFFKNKINSLLIIAIA